MASYYLAEDTPRCRGCELPLSEAGTLPDYCRDCEAYEREHWRAYARAHGLDGESWPPVLTPQAGRHGRPARRRT